MSGRCKACDMKLSSKQMDQALCTECWGVSNAAVFYAEQQEGNGSRAQEPSAAAFEKFVRQEQLEKSWEEGLGLMSPENRVAHMRNRCWHQYVDLMGAGVSHYTAVRQACGTLVRGDQQTVGDAISEIMSMGG